jgi:hypothetical protein
MAKYEVTYACGHIGTVNLFGETAERDRKVEWLKKQDCWECQKKKDFEAAQADETPVVIHIKSSSHNVTGKAMHLIAIATGGTYREKDNLKALGFSWGESDFDTGIFDLLSVKKPEKCWNKTIDVSIDDFNDQELLCRACGVIDGKIGNYKAELSINPLDLALLAEGIKKQKEETERKNAESAREKERKEKLGISPLRTYADSKGKYWNGKKYGNEKYGYRIYVDSVEYKIPADVMQAQETWYKHRDAVNAEYAKEEKK